MKALSDATQYEAVLEYCIERTLSGYDQAIHYGRLSGYLTLDNKLTIQGQMLARTPVSYTHLTLPTICSV